MFPDKLWGQDFIFVIMLISNIDFDFKFWPKDVHFEDM